MALNDKQAKAIKEKGKPLMDGVVPNLLLKSNGKAGRGMWVFRFVSPTVRDPKGQRSRRDMSLGIYPKVSIARARELAREAHELLSKGEDPMEQRRAVQRAKDAASSNITFAEACTDYLELHKGDWRNGSKSPAQWKSTLEAYAFPLLANKPIADLTPEDFRDVLKPIWVEMPETSTRLFQRCRKIMFRCLSLRLIAANPLEIVKELLPTRKSAATTRTSFPSLPWDQVPAFVQTLLRNGPVGTCREAMEFLILSGCRSKEVRGLVWTEIDWDKKVWTIPADRMKAQKEHRVPLTVRMLELLEKQRNNGRHSIYVFPAPRDGMFSDATMSKFLKDHKVPSDKADRFATVHGFRSSLRTWGADNGISEQVMELMLAHTERSSVKKAYIRTDLLEERRVAMEKWSSFLSK